MEQKPHDFLQAAFQHPDFNKAMENNLKEFIPRELQQALAPDQWKMLLGEYILALQTRTDLLEEEIQTLLIQQAEKYLSKEK